MFVGRRWQSVISYLRTELRRQARPRGILFTLALLLVAVTAVVSANNLLFLILAAMVSTVMVSNLVSRLSLAGLELDFHLTEHVSARREFPAQIYLRNGKRWMPSFSVQVAGTGDSVFSSPLYFPVIPGGAVMEERVTVRFERRGLHREDGFRFSTSFPFGFLERRAHVSLRRDILAYPCLDPQPGFEELLAALTGEIIAHYRGRGHDFYRIRPYEALESARHVDWKATAHTGELQVREFAREEEPLVEVFLDLNVPDTLLEWFEQAIDCCAFVVWHVLEHEARVLFSSQEFQISVPATGDVYTILKYLALVTPKRAKPPGGPNEEISYQIIFTATPEQYADSAWRSARIVGPAAFAGFAPGTISSARAAQNLHHGGGADRR